MDKLTLREKKFIIGGAIFLLSVILFFLNFKGGNLFPYSIFLGFGIFVILFPWINFKINKKIFLKLAIFLFLLRIASFVALLSHFGLVALYFFFSWIIYVIFNYSKSLNKSLGLKLLYFILITFISWLYYFYVPVIVWSVLFGLD